MCLLLFTLLLFFSYYILFLMWHFCNNQFTLVCFLFFSRRVLDFDPMGTNVVDINLTSPPSSQWSRPQTSCCTRPINTPRLFSAKSLREYWTTYRVGCRTMHNACLQLFFTERQWNPMAPTTILCPSRPSSARTKKSEAWLWTDD